MYKLPQWFSNKGWPRPPRFGYRKYSKGRNRASLHTHTLCILSKFYNFSITKLASLSYVFHVF